MKRMLTLLASFAVIAAIAAVVVTQRVDRFMDTPVTVPPAGMEIDIRPGTPFAAVSRELVDKGLIDSDRWLRVYVRWNDIGGAIQAGEYRVNPGATPRTLIEQFTTGSVRLYAFTIIEGWNQFDLLKAMHADEVLDSTMTDEDWPALLASLGSEHTVAEGLFLPETYRFPKGTTDRELLAQAYEFMQDALQEEWATRSEDAVVQSPYEALVLASIVEKETARTDERARISGVFSRRLSSRMRLQTDPTVIYGIGQAFDGNLTRKHLRTDTPYNTYTRHGLPPTPIAMPGRAAIHAALHPADGPELFFVATGLGDGSHKFSATKEEHDNAVAEYLRRLRSRRQGTP